MKRVLLYLVIILLVNISFLFSPKPIEGKGTWYIEYIILNDYMGFPINIDSYEFLHASIKPSLLLKNQSVRQARPVYIWLASGIGYSLHTLSMPLHNNLYDFLKLHFSGKYNSKQLQKATLYGSHYMGYILLNLFIMVLSAFLFEKCLLKISRTKRVSTILVCFLLIFLNSHPISKAFFWTAHQQMFSVFCPILCIYIGLNRERFLNSNYRLFTMSILCGLLLLLYGSFLLLLPLLLCSLLLQRYQAHNYNIAYLLGPVLTAIGLFFVPYIIWVSVLKLNNVRFYNHELEHYRELIWMVDAWKISPSQFFKSLFKNLQLYIATFPYLLLYILVLLIPLIIYKVINPEIFKGISTVRDKEILAFVFFIFLGFFALLGYYVDRLTFSLTPPILLFIGCLLVLNKAKKFLWDDIVLIVVAVGWHIYNITSYGPFS